jgi:Spy/CpxP family protein refolding chaperone
MTMKHILPTIAALVVVVASANLLAQPPSDVVKDDGKQGHHRMFAELNLSEQQKEQLKTLHEEMQTIRQKHMGEVKKVREKIKAELLKNDPSQNILYGYAAELGKLHEQMSKEHGDHLLKVKKVLSPEQFAKIVEKENDREWGKEFRDRKNEKCPNMKDAQHLGTCPHASEKPANTPVQ